jgi:hypothetical protein
MMRMDDVRASQRQRQTRREGLRRVPAPVAKRAHGPQPQTAGLAFDPRMEAEGDQLAIHALGQSACKLEWIALSAAKQAI